MNSSVEQLKELRHTLHQHPELSGKEVNTAETMSRFAKLCGASRVLENIGGHGVAAIFESGQEGPTVLVRCELDALPIREEGEMGYRSVIPGISHKCGHDGHMAIVSGVGLSVKDEPLHSGTVILLFQPAEETGEGAMRVIDDERFRTLKPDYVVSLHNLPGYPEGAVVLREGSFTASVISLKIELKGKTAHAAEPENGINPAMAISEIINQTAALQRPPEQVDFALVTPVQIVMGEEAFGVSAGEGEIKFTLRTWDVHSLQNLREEIGEIVECIAWEHGLEHNMTWVQSFASCKNDGRMTDIIRKAALELKLDIIENETPFKWGEDFGLFTQNYPGAMFGLGAGENVPNLHNPDYDFPDAIILNGVKLFRKVIDKLTQS